MTSNQSQELNHEAQIRALIERWAKAMTEVEVEKAVARPLNGSVRG
jgi:hypothetical protein